MIERVTSAISAAPIVVVGRKESEDVHVWGDFSVIFVLPCICMVIQCICKCGNISYASD